jgi:RND family efflux transporter MFP subunit
MNEPVLPKAPSTGLLSCGFAALFAGCLLVSANPVFSQPMQQPPVTVAKPVERTVVEWAEYTGRFLADSCVEIQSRVSGYLQSIEFEDGQLVKEGDVLFVLDGAPFEAAVQRARGAVAAAKSRLDLEQSRLNRGQRLLESNTIAREESDTRAANVEIARAELVTAQANLRTAELELSYTRIKAPLNGRVSYSRVDVGNVVTGGSSSGTLLTTLVSTDPIKFEFDIDESDYLNYTRLIGKAGRPTPENPWGPVDVRLLDETEFTRQGRVEFADNTFDLASATLRMRAVFDNPDEKLIPGLFGRLRLAVRPPYQALMIDPRAVLADQAMQLVMAVADDGTVTPRPVRLGPIENGLQVVREGLAGNDRVIISGLLRAQPGSKVTPVEAPMTPGTATAAAR